jgi:cytochrome c biogenesis protein
MERCDLMSRKIESIPEPFKSFWKFFASIQLTVVVLLSLASASIIGTLIPQNQNPREYLNAYGDFWFRFYGALDIFDMYHSWWFQMLLIFLAANLVVCSIDRLSATWSILFPKDRHFKPNRFRKLKNNFQFNSGKDADALKSLFSETLNTTFGYLKMEDTPKGFLIFAEKGRWTRFGVYAVHLSVLLLLIGGLVGSFWGIEGFMTIAEGESVDTIQLRNSGELKKLDFAIRCDDFFLSHYPNGAPKEFRSSLTVLKNGKAVMKKDIIVNDPLKYQNISFYQSSYGELPPESSIKASKIPEKPPERIVLNLTSSGSQMTYQREATIGKKIELPEGLGNLLLKVYKVNAKFGGQDIGPSFVGDLISTDGKSEEVLLPLKYPNFDKMRRGKISIAVAEQQQEKFSSDEPSEPRYYTGIGVTNDPGVGIVYCGFILMIVGCYIAFFTSHQQVFIEVTDKKDTFQHVFISGTSNKDKLAMKRRVVRLKDKLAKLAEQ